MIEPERPSQQYIEGRISFHQSGAEWFERMGQKQLAEWSRSLVAKWAEKLQALKCTREVGDGE
jgi:hypothetical protein